jgi:hypothetical protein
MTVNNNRRYCTLTVHSPGRAHHAMAGAGQPEASWHSGATLRRGSRPVYGVAIAGNQGLNQSWYLERVRYLRAISCHSFAVASPELSTNSRSMHAPPLRSGTEGA